MKVQCRRCPESVNSTNATWQTSFGLTQRHCLPSGESRHTKTPLKFLVNRFVVWMKFHRLAWSRRLLNISHPRIMVEKLKDMVTEILEEIADLPQKVTAGGLNNDVAPAREIDGGNGD